jgi:hypothetical protein
MTHGGSQMAVSNYFRNRKIKDKLRIELLKPTSLPVEAYESKLPSQDEMSAASVIYREFEYDNLDILYVAEGKRQYGRAISVHKDGRTLECTQDEWVKITKELARMAGFNL